MWKYDFFAVQSLVHPVILGANFLAKTGFFMDIGEEFLCFKFDPINRLAIRTLLTL
jgi:hypothetical protein